MKKLFAVFVLLLLATGCDGDAKMMSCTSTTTQNGIVTKTSYDVEYVDDEVKYVTITYDYSSTGNGESDDDMDGVNADTDGITEDEDVNDNNRGISGDEVVDGVVGDTIDTTVDSVRETILDIAGIKNTYENQLSMYDNIEGFTYDVQMDNTDQYKIVYTIDMDKISDEDLATFDVSRNFTEMQDDYEGLGYTCR